MQSEKYIKWIILLIVILLVVLACNIWTIWKLTQLKAPEPSLRIPKSFVINYPECANKLLESMNISNVHIKSISKALG